MTEPVVALSATEKRALLAELLRKKTMEPRRAPLSAAQQRLWFLHQLAPQSPTYNICAAFRLAGPFDVDAAQRTLHEVVRRHETLRTTFATEDGRPVQLIAPALAVPLHVVDLRGLAAPEREIETERRVTIDAQQPFDLERGPLLRVGVVRLADDDHVFFSTMHHLVSDFWSFRVLRDEITALYAAAVGGAAPPLPEPPIQYADFVAWQRGRFEGDEHRAALAFWKRTLAGPLPVLELRTDRPRPAVKSHRGAIHRFALSPRTSAELKALGRGQGVTPFMILVTAFTLVLSRYTGQRDILIGTPVAGRKRVELEGLIGCFVNTVVLRVDLGGDPSVRELLARVRDVTLGAYAHDDVPFEELVQQLRPERDPSHTPLVQVMLVLHQPSSPMLGLRQLDIHNGTAKFDLSLEVVDSDDHFRGAFEYDTDLFERATIARAAEHFVTLLDAMLAAPDRRILDLPLLTEAEHREIRKWNDTRMGFPRAANVAELIGAQAARTPDAIAVVFEDAGLTYGELWARAHGLAHRLRALGVGPDVPVGVCMERSLELIVALLAIFEAGGVYLPLDPAYPSERLALALAESRTRVVLTGPAPGAWLVALRVPLIAVDAAAPERVGGGGTPRRPGTAGPEHLAYILYTSGSTGTPKGAMIAHGALANRLRWMQGAYPITAGDRVLQKTPISFDVSVWELLWPLLAGATLVMARPHGHRNGPYLAELIADQGVTVTHFVPSMLRVFLEQPGLEARCRSLRHVFSSGEPLTPDLVRRFFARIDAALHNLYGPTEAAIDVTAWTCLRDGSARGVPIGRPIANTQVHLLDAGHQPVPVGHPGELYIGGAGLARGYLGRPGLTAERFVPDGFGEPGRRVYRTGDLARYRPDGNIEFLGRGDRQVKVRGCRVELGEVERALDGHPCLRAVVADAQPDTAGETRLVAYVVARSEPAPGPAELRAFLKERLPDYMVPTVFVMLRDLPLTPSGKVDHRALPAPGRPEGGATLPRTATERLLAGIWSDVLGVDRIGVEDNFFDLGGASIQCLRVVARANESGLPMTPEMLFEHQTVAELAAAVDGR